MYLSDIVPKHFLLEIALSTYPIKSNEISNRHFMFESTLHSIHYPTWSQRGIFISKMHYLPHRL